MHTRSPQNVLIVDDESAIALTLTKIFEVNGYNAASCCSAEEALHLITIWKPNLVILDLRLPEMNGIELAGRIHNKDPNCAIILYTGHGDLTESMIDDGRPYLCVASKPIHPKELLALAVRLLDRKQKDIANSP